MNILHYLQYKKRLILNILGWFVFIFSIVCNFSTYNSFKLDSVFNADMLGAPLFFNDLFREGGSLKDWYMGASPCIFPDVILYLFFSELFHLDFISILFFYGITQSILVVYLSSFLYKKLAPPVYKEYAWLIPVFYSFVFLESYYNTGHEVFAFLMLVYGYHTGAFISALLAMCIYVSELKHGWKYVLLFLFTLLATFSDILFVPMFIGPIIVLNIFMFRFKGVKFSVLSSVFIVSGCALAFYIYEYVKANLVYFSNPSKIYAFDNIMPSLKIFYEHMLAYITLGGFRGFQIAFAFVAPIVCFIILILKRKTLSKEFKFLLFFYVVFSVIVFSAPILNGNYTAWDTIRYNIAPIFFSMTILALLIAFIFNRFITNSTTQLIVSYLIPVFFVFLISLKFSPVGLKDYFTYYPPKVKEIDSICKKYNLKNGISNYWNAKWVSVFSKNHVKVLSMHSTVFMYELGSNIKWFYNREFDFVIANKLDSARIRQLFIIKDTIKTPNFTVLRVNKFIFPDKKYEPLTIDTVSHVGIKND